MLGPFYDACMELQTRVVLYARNCQSDKNSAEFCSNDTLAAPFGLLQQ